MNGPDGKRHSRGEERGGGTLGRQCGIRNSEFGIWFVVPNYAFRVTFEFLGK
jgi:hypothetical protein